MLSHLDTLLPVICLHQGPNFIIQCQDFNRGRGHCCRLLRPCYARLDAADSLCCLILANYHLRGLFRLLTLLTSWLLLIASGGHNADLVTLATQSSHHFPLHTHCSQNKRGALNRRITVNKLNPRDEGEHPHSSWRYKSNNPSKQTEIAGFQILSSAKNPSFSDN